MIVLGISIVFFGILTYIFLFKTKTKGEKICGVIFSLLFSCIFFWISTIYSIDIPGSPKNLTLKSYSEEEVVCARGQYWIFNQDDKFIPVFDKDLQSYVVYDKNIDSIKVYKEQYQKPDRKWISFIDLNDYTYYKIVLAE